MHFLVHVIKKCIMMELQILGRNFFCKYSFFFSYTVKGILNLQYLSNDFFLFRHH